MARRLLPWLLGVVLCACPAAAADEPIRDPAWGADCSLMTGKAYATIPILFYENRADSLLGLLDRWELYCARDEVITRTRILGAVWDGAFTEDLYDHRIMDDLVRRGAEFRDGSAATPARATYDSFTVDLADQLLPHQPAGTPEEFFCLFYSGRTEEAWALMDGGDLAFTDLAYYRARALSLLEASSSRLLVGAYAGNWYPTGDLEWVGEKPLLGLEVGWWEKRWFGRLVGEWRPGRTDTPYLVEEAGTVYYSDRWDALLLAGEAGFRLLGTEDWRVDIFGGVGVDVVKPLGASNDLLSTIHLALGAGLRYGLTEDSRWYFGFDFRTEATGDRNAELTNIGGEAWSARFVFGRVMTSADQETARLLGR